MTKQVYKFKKCDSCPNKFMSDGTQTTCDDCLGKQPKEISNISHMGSYDRLGDNNFKGASNEWFDFLRKVKSENPNSNIDVK